MVISICFAVTCATVFTYCLAVTESFAACTVFCNFNATNLSFTISICVSEWALVCVLACWVTFFVKNCYRSLTSVNCMTTCWRNIKSFSVAGTGYGERNYCYSIPGQTVYVLPQNATYVEHAQNLINKVFDGGTLTDEDLVLPAQ